MRSASIEKSWTRVRETSLRHQITSLDDTVNVTAVDANNNTHDEVATVTATQHTVTSCGPVPYHPPCSWLHNFFLC